MSTQEMLHGLSERKLNVALLVQVPHKLMTGLTFEELHRCPICLAVHPAHRLAQMRKVGLEQVARERLITYTGADYPEYRAWLAGLFAPLNLVPQIAEEHDSATSVIAAAEAGRGVALVAQDLVWLAGPSLKVRPLVPAPPAIIFGIAYRKGVNSPMAKNFIAATKRIDSIVPAQAS